jgi:hypothetical protein
MLVLQSRYSCAVSCAETLTLIQMPDMYGHFTYIMYKYIEIRMLGMFVMYSENLHNTGAPFSSAFMNFIYSIFPL